MSEESGRRVIHGAPGHFARDLAIGEPKQNQGAAEAAAVHSGFSLRHPSVLHEPFYGLISTRVPTGTRSQISSISALVTAMQPSVQSVSR